MTDATERACEVIAEALKPEVRFIRTELSILVRDALMANPDLLVDLALEAGGLEQVGYAHPQPPDGKGWQVHGSMSLHMNDQPVYRRKEKNRE